MVEKNIFLDAQATQEFRDKIKAAGKAEKEAFIKGPLYSISRIESGTGNPLFDIEGMHGFSILDIIRNKLDSEKQFEQRKLKILDLGGGIGAFADQIRENFGARIKIYTTGILKKRVKDWRKNQSFDDVPELNDDFPPTYLKWRSILELNKTDKKGQPTEEFDVIINTYGEIPYGQGGDEKLLQTYIEAVIKKLRPGGIASIAPAGGKFEKQDGRKKDKFIPLDKTQLQNLIENLQSLFPNIQITLSYSNKITPVLFIQKDMK